MWSRLHHLFGIELNVVSSTEKLLSAIGGAISIGILVVITHANLGVGPAAACLVASMGASAVLLFAVPHGQLSQPWPVLAGHGFSALIGVLCQRYVPELGLASGLAVGLSILAMHQFKCIHPPGGATALTAVIGGQVISEMGWYFVVFPVLLNALSMVGLAVLFNLPFAWRRYPASLIRRKVVSTSTPAELRATPSHEDIVRALKSMDSFVDVTEEDLLVLTRLLQRGEGERARERGKAREMSEAA